MKKIFVFLGFILLVALAQAGPPPGEIPTFDLEEVANVAEQDNVIINAPVISNLAQEVAHRPPWSQSVTVNKAPALEIKQELTALMINRSDIEFTLKCPPDLYARKGKLYNDRSTFLTNKQNSNYGYPLSARTKIVFS